MRKFANLLLLFFCLICCDAKAQYNVRDFTYSHLSTSNGLCNQRIYSIQKSNDGAIWWASKNCIERYNGVQIKHYNLSEQGSVHNVAGRTYSLAECSENIFAFDNNGSIFEYSQSEDKFNKIVDLYELMKRDIVLYDVLVIDGGIMLSMREGAYYYSLSAKKLYCMKKDLYTRTIVKSKIGYLLCTVKGVYGLLYKNISISDKGIKIGKVDYLSPRDIQKGFYDSENDNIWLGGYNNGLTILNKGNLKQINIDGIPKNPIRCFCPLDNRTMLVGVDGFGLYQVDRKTLKASILFDANEGPNSVLHGNGIYSVVIDNWNNIFIGSYSGGIDIARPVGSTTAVFEHVRNNLHTIINDHVNCVDQYIEDWYVMGTDDGVSLYNSKTTQWNHLCRGEIVLSTKKSPQGTLLVGTYGNGVLEVSKTGQVKRLYNEENGILKDNHVYNLFYDRAGNLWIGTLNGQLTVKTPKGFIYYPIDNVQDIKQLDDGRIVIATIYGVKIVDTKSNSIKEIVYGRKEDNFNRCALNLLVDGSILYIATDGSGIYKYNIKTGESSQLTTDNGLSSNIVCSLAKDNRGRIFIATEKGLGFISPDNQQKVIDVNYCYGLNREYIRSAVSVLFDGKILYGTTSGALIVDPMHIQEIDYTAKLNVFAPSKLKLSYSERTFNLHYECINIRNQYDIVYIYKVGDGEWSNPTAEQLIRFVNLEPGTHNLTIRAISKSCQSVLDEVEMKIVIAQPWWNSWWMWCIYIMILVGAFYGAWKVYELHEKYMRLVSQISSIEQGELTEEKNDLSEDTEDDAAEGKEFVDKATKLVLDKMSDPDFNIDSLCREMAMSRTMFYLRLKSYTGKSPQDFLRIIRLERAASLLRAGKSVMEASVAVGFDNTKYFSTVFKKYFGVSPSKYNK